MARQGFGHDTNGMRVPYESLRFWCVVDIAALALLGAAVAGAQPPPSFCTQQFVDMQPLAPGFASLSAKPKGGTSAPACIRLLFEG
jgi:hypothetical protein